MKNKMKRGIAYLLVMTVLSTCLPVQAEEISDEPVVEEESTIEEIPVVEEELIIEDEPVVEEETNTEDEHAHSYSYFPNEDGTHTVTCNSGDCTYSEIFDCDFKEITEENAVIYKCVDCGYKKDALEGETPIEEKMVHGEPLLEEEFSAEQVVDDIKVCVKADEGVIPSGAELKVEKVVINSEIQELAEQNVEGDVEDAVAFDITILLDGVEIQPDTSKGQVYVTFENIEIPDTDGGVKVMHVSDDMQDIEEVNVTDIQNESVEFEVEHFSIYLYVYSSTLNASYQYTLSSLNEKIMMKDLLEDLGCGYISDYAYATLYINNSTLPDSEINKLSEQANFELYNSTIEESYVVFTKESSGVINLQLWKKDKTTKKSMTLKYSYENTEEYDYQYGDNVYGKYNEDTCVLIISGTGDMWEFVSDIGKARTLPSSCEKVIIENGVTNIGNNAFDNCAGLKSVTIPDSVTSIGHYAFSDCTSLTSISIPDSVTSIGSYAFSGCSQLTSITIPDSVTSIGHYAFQQCTALTSVTIPDGVASIEMGTFWGCSSLNSIEIPDSVTSIKDRAFMYCGSLTSIAIPVLVTSIGADAFSYTYLTSIIIPDSVTSIGADAFSYTYLTSIIIPDSVTSIGNNAFYVRSNTKTYLVTANDVALNYDWEGSNRILSYNVQWLNSDDTLLHEELIAIGSEAVYPNENPSSGVDGEYFAGWEIVSGSDSMDNITQDTVIKAVYKTIKKTEYSDLKIDTEPSTNTFVEGTVPTFTDGTFTVVKTIIYSDASWDEEPANLTISDVTWSETALTTTDTLITFTYGTATVNMPITVKEIVDFTLTASNYTQAGIVREGNVVIPEIFEYDGTTYRVTAIGAGAFRDCTSLTSVTIPDSVTTIGTYVFKNCKSLSRVSIGSGLKTISEGAFNYCKSLKNIIIPNNVIYINKLAFGDCESLTSVTIPDSVEIIGERAFEYTGLTHVTIPDSVEIIGERAFDQCRKLKNVSIGIGVKEISRDMFNYCTGLTSITIPDSVESIETGAFYNCTSLKNIIIPDSIKTIKGKTYWGAFEKCTGLTSVVIPNSVTSIGEHTFYGCTGLTSVVIPDSVTSIGKQAFHGCAKLTNIKVGSGVTSIYTNTFYVSNNLLTTLETDNEIALTYNWASDNRTVLRNVKWLNSDDTVLYEGTVEIRSEAVYPYENPASGTEGEYFAGWEIVSGSDSMDKITKDTVLKAVYKTIKKTEYSDLKIDTEPSTNTFVEGTVPTFTDGTFTVNKTIIYSDNSWEEEPANLTISDVTWSETALTTTDTSITFTYGTATVNMPIIVNKKTETARTLKKIIVKTTPNKTEYYDGDAVDLTGLTLEAEFEVSYNNGTTDTAKEIISNLDEITAGKTAVDTDTENITVSYTYGAITKTASFDIEVQDVNEVFRELKSVSVKTAPTKTSYIEDQDVDITGLKMTATFLKTMNNGSKVSETITVDNTDVVFNPERVSLGDDKITLSYTYGTVTKSSEVEITVSEKSETKRTLKGIVVKTNPTKTAYYEGDTVELAGIVVKATYTVEYNNGTSSTIEEEVNTEDLKCEPNKVSKDTEKVAISFKYGDVTKSADVPVTVTELEEVSKILTGITIEREPNKKDYEEDEVISLEGISVKATYNVVYNNGASTTTTADIPVEFLTVNPTKATAKKVTVSFKDGNIMKNATYDVNINHTPSITYYTVKFLDGDTVLKEEQVQSGASATAPANPSKTGYVFEKWDKAFDEIRENTVITAVWKKRTFTIIFKDYDDSVIAIKTAEYEDVIEESWLPSEPSRDGYTFTGWTNFNVGKKLTTNMVCRAKYTAISIVIPTPTTKPTAEPTSAPIEKPTTKPTVTPEPSVSPSPSPSATPTSTTKPTTTPQKKYEQTETKKTQTTTSKKNKIILTEETPSCSAQRVIINTEKACCLEYKLLPVLKKEA